MEDYQESRTYLLIDNNIKGRIASMPAKNTQELEFFVVKEEGRRF